MSDDDQTLTASHRSSADRPKRDGFLQYRAPRGNGESLVQPGFAEVPELLHRNMEQLKSHGEPFVSLRKAARQQLTEAAIRYTSAYRDVDWVRDWQADHQTKPIIMAGHQPALFHPGVWFKNFALSHLAEQTGGLAINLIVNNDVATGSSIRVPTFDRATGRGSYRRVSYDDAGGGVPYEQTTIRDRDRFDRFDQEVVKAISPLVSDPCVTQLWRHAQEAIAHCGVAG